MQAPETQSTADGRSTLGSLQSTCRRVIGLEGNTLDINDVRPKSAVVKRGNARADPCIEPSGAGRIEQSGGRVIFVRYPVSGLIWKQLEKNYPRAAYWDEFAQHTRFATVHFKDYPELQFQCPDYSHLDMSQSPVFTQALAKILLERKLIERGK
jgi:hypothetical protein